MDKVTTRTAVMWKDENSIFWVQLIADVEIDKEDVVDNLLVTRTITENKPHLKVLDSRSNWKMTKEAEEYFKREDSPEKTIARAVLVRSVADKLIRKFLITLYKPNVPINFFTSESEAVKWLLEHKK
ncbi:MAG: DUF7793 family protein [Bacteroidia bacterium]